MIVIGNHGLRGILSDYPPIIEFMDGERLIGFGFAPWNVTGTTPLMIGI